MNGFRSASGAGDTLRDDTLLGEGVLADADVADPRLESAGIQGDCFIVLGHRCDGGDDNN